MTVVNPSQSNAGDTIEAADINTPVNQLAAVINGGIDSTNIADAGVSTAKLADGSVTFLKVATGAAVQMVSALFSAVATGTTLIPNDDTIPQITEGNEYMTLAITPKSATNVLFIQVTAFLSSLNATQVMTAALFQDATASALAASSTFTDASTVVPKPVTLLYTMTAGTTSSTTFRVRAGSHQASTTTFNGVNGGRIYGAIPKSSIVITEYKA